MCDNLSRLGRFILKLPLHIICSLIGLYIVHSFGPSQLVKCSSTLLKCTGVSGLNIECYCPLCQSFVRIWDRDMVSLCFFSDCPGI